MTESLASFRLARVVTGLVDWAAPDAAGRADGRRPVLAAAKTRRPRPATRRHLQQALRKLNAQRATVDAIMQSANRSLSAHAIATQAAGVTTSETLSPMPGMNSGLNDNNPTLVAAFRAALLHQGLIVLLIFAMLAVAWVSAREWLRPGQASAARPSAEPAWRQLLRIGFGVIWIFDGLLQAQPAMAAGLPSQVIEPTAASSPGLGAARGELGRHRLVVPPDPGGRRGGLDPDRDRRVADRRAAGLVVRLAGLASVAWGLVVWVFGEAFGGIFAPGLTWLFGAPGAVLFYCAAGVLIALPERSWRDRAARPDDPGRCWACSSSAWPCCRPGRDGASGRARVHGQPGTLDRHGQLHGQHPAAGILLAGWVRGFASFTAAHGFAVNLFAVIALAAIGAGLVTVAAGRGPGLAGPGHASSPWSCSAWRTGC